MKKYLVLMAAVVIAIAASAQGTLTAYYAKVALNDYTKGKLIVDSNDPFNRIVSVNATSYRYEGDDGGGDYSSLIPKAKVLKRVYKMSPLPVALVGKRMTFVSSKGLKATIFMSYANGHSFYNYDGTEKDAAATAAHQKCYVLSVQIPSINPDEGSYRFEEQLDVEDGNIRLYQMSRFTDNTVKNLRYRPNKIGFIEEQWVTPENYPYDRSAFDENGRLLADQWKMADIPDYISVAYIADINALYVNGELYYR